MRMSHAFKLAGAQLRHLDGGLVGFGPGLQEQRTVKTGWRELVDFGGRQAIFS